MATLPAPLAKAYQSLVTIKIVVNSAETRAAVSKHWGDCTRFIKDTKKAILELKKPFKQQIDEIDAACKPMLVKAEELERQAEAAILAYDRAERAKIQAQNEKKIEKYEAKVANKEAEAVANNKPMPFVPLPSLKAEPAKTVTIGDMKQTTVKIKKWRIPGIADPSTISRADAVGKEIPDDLFILDTAKVTRLIKAGGNIPGIESYVDETLSLR